MLIKCRECGRKVSDASKVCPHCGVPSPDASRLKDWRGRLEIIAGIAIMSTLMAFAIWAENLGGYGSLLIFALFLVIALIGAILR